MGKHMEFVHQQKDLESDKENDQAKGQLMSEGLFGVWNFPKNKRNSLMNFCPRP